MAFSFEEEIIFEDNDWTLRLHFAAQRMMYIPEKLILEALQERLRTDRGEDL